MLHDKLLSSFGQNQMDLEIEEHFIPMPRAAEINLIET